MPQLAMSPRSDGADLDSGEEQAVFGTLQTCGVYETDVQQALHAVNRGRAVVHKDKRKFANAKRNDRKTFEKKVRKDRFNRQLRRKVGVLAGSASAWSTAFAAASARIADSMDIGLKQGLTVSQRSARTRRTRSHRRGSARPSLPHWWNAGVALRPAQSRRKAMERRLGGAITMLVVEPPQLWSWLPPDTT